MTSASYFIQIHLIKLMFITSGLGFFALISMVIEYCVLDSHLYWTSSIESNKIKDINSNMDLYWAYQSYDLEYDWLGNTKFIVCGDRFLYNDDDMDEHMNISKNTSEDFLMETFKKPNVDVNLVIKKLHSLPKFKGTPPWDEVPYLHICNQDNRENMAHKCSNCSSNLSNSTNHSPWFKEVYQKNVKVFLDESDINMPNIFYKLDKFPMPYGLRRQHKTVLAQLVNNLNFTNPPLKSLLHQNTSDKCVRCAVVGGGGILNGSKLGEEIDAHQYVFRMNNVVIKDHSNDVGKKTTFYIFYPESERFDNITRNKDVISIFVAFKSYDLQYALNLAKGILPPPFLHQGNPNLTVDTDRMPNIRPSRLKVIHPDFIRYVHEKYLNKHKPTTGALAVLLAMHLCDQVSVYGFGYDPQYSIHYYDTEFVKYTNISTRSHDIHSERKLWETLHDQGIIKLYKPKR